MKTSLKQRLENYIDRLENNIEFLKNYKQEAIQKEIYTDVINYNASLINLINTRDELKDMLK